MHDHLVKCWFDLLKKNYTQVQFYTVANSVDPDEMLHLIRVYTGCHSSERFKHI